MSLSRYDVVANTGQLLRELATSFGFIPPTHYKPAAHLFFLLSHFALQILQITMAIRPPRALPDKNIRANLETLLAFGNDIKKAARIERTSIEKRLRK